MKIFSRLISIIKNYNKLRSLKWTKKGIFPYIFTIISIINFIVSHPLFKVFKFMFHILIIFEGLLFIIYYYEFPFIYDVKDLQFTFTSLYDFVHQMYSSILRKIRDKINYLLDEQIIQPNDNYEAISINTDKLYSDQNNTYKWLLGITIVILISGVAIYYYYPEIINYFKDNNERPDNNIPDNPNINYNDDELDLSVMNTPDSNFSTPKASASRLPPFNENPFKKKIKIIPYSPNSSEIKIEDWE